VRTYAASLPSEAPGNWFRALFDRELAPALEPIPVGRLPGR
jgi:hypothetical protein